MRFLFAFLLTLPAYGYVVVSDLDDTIKISNSAHAGAVTWNALFTQKVFSGMPEYLRATSQERSALYVVTGTIGVVRPRVESFLRHHGIAVNDMLLRPDLGQDIMDFKVAAISKLLARHPGEAVVLVGDDVDKDPEAYLAVAARYPGQVRAIYIRPVRHRPLPTGVTPYLSAVDIASLEHGEGRLTQPELDGVVEAVMAGKASHVLPGFVWCPTHIPANYASRAYGGVVAKLEGICKARRSGI